MKNTHTADFCAERIDVITNFAVITNVVIKRVGSQYKSLVSGNPSRDNNLKPSEDDIE